MVRRCIGLSFFSLFLLQVVRFAHRLFISISLRSSILKCSISFLSKRSPFHFYHPKSFVATILFMVALASASGQLLAQSLNFPALTGRVVDQAGILSPEVEAKLKAVLQDVEKTSTDQIVVVTVGSLEGVPIEDYGYQLGRHWGIGQQGKDNGVLLIVAPNERKVRIEVGSGLEGVLPDALAGLIIQRRILPAFKKGDLAGGILIGVEDIKTSLLGNGEEVALRAKKPEQQIDPYLPLIFFAFWLIPFVYFVSSLSRDRQVGGRIPGGVVILPGSYGGAHNGWHGPGGFSRTSGGGFSGGGGGFGGGGASGSW